MAANRFGAARYRQLSQQRLVDRTGREMPGYLADLSQKARRAVIVVHDFFGLTEHIKSVSGRLAVEGFVAFAPDLYRGRVAGSREEAATLAQSLAWNRVAIELGLAAQALQDKTEGGPVAICGFAMGGAAALVAAASNERLTAAVTFYGIPQDVSIENRHIKIQGHFASRDRKCTPERVEALDHALTKRGGLHQFHSYDADNGFLDPTRSDVHSATLAQLAWDRTVAFLDSACG
jgi:carboxymethylenebutenolidase